MFGRFETNCITMHHSSHHMSMVCMLAYNVLPFHRTIPCWFSEIGFSVSSLNQKISKILGLDPLAPYFQQNSSSFFHNVHDAEVQLRHKHQISMGPPFLGCLSSEIGCIFRPSHLDTAPHRKRLLRSAERPKRLRGQKERKMNPWQGSLWGFPDLEKDDFSIIAQWYDASSSGSMIRKG